MAIADQAPLLEQLRAIRERLDGIELQLRWQVSRLELMEKRFATLVEAKLNVSVPVPSATFQSPPGPAG